jgi:hypothetical protein
MKNILNKYYLAFMAVILFSSGTFKKSTIPNTFLVLKTNKLVRLKN